MRKSARYASDGVNPELLGMTKVANENSVRRALPALEEAESEKWVRRHRTASYEPLWKSRGRWKAPSNGRFPTCSN